MDDKNLVNQIARQLDGDYDWRGAISVIAKSGLQLKVNHEMKRLGYSLRCIENPIMKRYPDDEQESIYNPTGKKS